MVKVWLFIYSSPQQGDLKLLGPPSGQGASGGARIRDRRAPADLRVDSLNTEPQTPQMVKDTVDHDSHHHHYRSLSSSLSCSFTKCFFK
ncbi:hypothetical protein PoB_004829800 [Plakobranchus ocellatus]|uniref:Uncharacterized protein n=1 Tax=Plakobranchus ocellatus TaxID=259542 RepID=A0AAV4BSH3_9GAST|nr:hypothetical protein PoB_004829800 [Plakobranchus ocellatus]